MQCSSRFSNVLFFTVHTFTLISVNYPIFLSFWVTRRSLMVLSLLMCIYIPYLLQIILYLSLGYLVYGITIFLSLILLCAVLFLILLELVFVVCCFILWPCSKTNWGTYILVLFVCGGTNSPGSVCQCVDYILFYNQFVMAVPPHVLISVIGLPVHCCDKDCARSWHHQSVKEGNIST